MITIEHLCYFLSPSQLAGLIADLAYNCDDGSHGQLAEYAALSNIIKKELIKSCGEEEAAECLRNALAR